MGGGDVLGFDLGAEGEPGGAVGKVVWGEVCGDHGWGNWEVSLRLGEKFSNEGEQELGALMPGSELAEAVMEELGVLF